MAGQGARGEGRKEKKVSSEKKKTCDCRSCRVAALCVLGPPRFHCEVCVLHVQGRAKACQQAKLYTCQRCGALWQYSFSVGNHEGEWIAPEGEGERTGAGAGSLVAFRGVSDVCPGCWGSEEEVVLQGYCACGVVRQSVGGNNYAFVFYPRAHNK